MTQFSVHRTKGRIITTGLGVKMIQGVREVFEVVDLEATKTLPSQQPGQARSHGGKVILIGRGLQSEVFQGSLDNTLSYIADGMAAVESCS